MTEAFLDGRRPTQGVRMSEEQKITTIEKEALKDKAVRFRNSGWRLSAISATALEAFELLYSFEKDYEMESLRLIVPRDKAEIPSLSAIYANAFLYENEIHDLFGINVTGLSIDYKGNFYKIALKAPFAGPGAPSGETKNG